MTGNAAAGVVVGLALVVALLLNLSVFWYGSTRRRRRVRRPRPSPPGPRSVRLRRLDAAATDDLRLTVWVDDRDGQRLVDTDDPDRVLRWPAHAEPLRLLLRTNDDTAVGRVTVNLVVPIILRDTDVEVALLAADGVTVLWRDVVRRGTQWLHETVVQPIGTDEWQPVAHWDASRPLSVLRGPEGGVAVWLPLRPPPWPRVTLHPVGGGRDVLPRGAAVRLEPGGSLVLDAAIPLSVASTGTAFLVFRRVGGDGGVRPVLSLVVGTTTVLLVLLGGDTIAVHTARSGGAGRLTESIRHTAAVCHTDCVVLGLVYAFDGQRQLTLRTLATGDHAPRLATVPDFAWGPTAVLRVGADQARQAALDVHELRFFTRAMDDTMLRDMHAELARKWSTTTGAW
jgi:hypothetical protein